MSLQALPNQERDEQCVLFLRRYWIDLAGAFLYSVALLVIPIAALFVLNITGIDIAAEPFWGAFLRILLACYLLVVLVITLAQISDYYLDTWIVTNRRIINIEQKGLFSRTVSELHLNQVQDVTSETKGFLETFLTYGDVHVQTAGERSRFHFINIDNPDEVKVTISRLVAEAKKRDGDASQAAVAPTHKA